MPAIVRVVRDPRSLIVSASRTVSGVNAATLSPTMRPNPGPVVTGASPGSLAMLGSSAAAAMTSGGMIASAAATVPA